MEIENKKYQVIYADPPWDYGVKSSFVLLKGGTEGKGGHWQGKKKDNKGLNSDKEKLYQTLTKQELMDLKINKYQVIYADPPWKYPDSSHTLLAGENGKGGHWAGKTKDWNSWNERPKGEFKKLYPSLTKEELSELPIKDLTDKDAACFMWTTDTHLPQAIEIMKAWGFTYKNIAFVWEKQTCNGNPVNLMAPWTLKSYEICLLGTKGAMRKHKKDNTIRQIVKAERVRHSQKPQEVADRIVKLFPDVNRIELFARDAKPGWDVWGNEIQSDINL